MTFHDFLPTFTYLGIFLQKFKWTDSTVNYEPIGFCQLRPYIKAPIEKYLNSYKTERNGENEVTNCELDERERKENWKIENSNSLSEFKKMPICRGFAKEKKKIFFGIATLNRGLQGS